MDNHRGFSVLILLVIVAAVGAAGFYFYKHGTVKSLNKGAYQDAETGFSLAIPQNWKEIGYSVDKEVDVKTGARIFSFVLEYKDANGTAHEFASVSTIAAVPVVAVSSFCRPSPVDCASTEELGRNSTYVFLSVTNSPQAWGDCTPGTPNFDQSFYDQNKALCEAGRVALSYPERNEGSFTVLEAK